MSSHTNPEPYSGLLKLILSQACKHDADSVLFGSPIDTLEQKSYTVNVSKSLGATSKVDELLGELECEVAKGETDLQTLGLSTSKDLTQIWFRIAQVWNEQPGTPRLLVPEMMSWLKKCTEIELPGPPAFMLKVCVSVLSNGSYLLALTQMRKRA